MLSLAHKQSKQAVLNLVCFLKQIRHWNIIQMWLKSSQFKEEGLKIIGREDFSKLLHSIWL